MALRYSKLLASLKNRQPTEILFIERLFDLIRRIQVRGATKINPVMGG
jgi:hypothetical protein